MRSMFLFCLLSLSLIERSPSQTLTLEYLPPIPKSPPQFGLHDFEVGWTYWEEYQARVRCPNLENPITVKTKDGTSTFTLDPSLKIEFKNGIPFVTKNKSTSDSTGPKVDSKLLKSLVDKGEISPDPFSEFPPRSIEYSPLSKGDHASYRKLAAIIGHLNDEVSVPSTEAMELLPSAETARDRIKTPMEAVLIAMHFFRDMNETAAAFAEMGLRCRLLGRKAQLQKQFYETLLAAGDRVGLSESHILARWQVVPPARKRQSLHLPTCQKLYAVLPAAFSKSATAPRLTEVALTWCENIMEWREDHRRLVRFVSHGNTPPTFSAGAKLGSEIALALLPTNIPVVVAEDDIRQRIQVLSECEEALTALNKLTTKDGILKSGLERFRGYARLMKPSLEVVQHLENKELVASLQALNETLKRQSHTQTLHATYAKSLNDSEVARTQVMAASEHLLSESSALATTILERTTDLKQIEKDVKTLISVEAPQAGAEVTDLMTGYERVKRLRNLRSQELSLKQTIAELQIKRGLLASKANTLLGRILTLERDIERLRGQLHPLSEQVNALTQAAQMATSVHQRWTQRTNETAQWHQIVGTLIALPSPGTNP